MSRRAHAATAPAFIQRAAEIETRGLKSRRETEENPGEKRNENVKPSTAPSSRISAMRGMFCGTSLDEHLRSPRREQQTEKAADRSQQHALHE